MPAQQPSQKEIVVPIYKILLSLCISDFKWDGSFLVHHDEENRHNFTQSQAVWAIEHTLQSFLVSGAVSVCRSAMLFLLGSFIIFFMKRNHGNAQVIMKIKIKIIER